MNDYTPQILSLVEMAIKDPIFVPYFVVFSAIIVIGMALYAVIVALKK